jgi:hypothetical protein
MDQICRCLVDDATDAFIFVSSFMVLERDLYSKKVSLSEYGILNDPESDILVTERLVASLRFARLTSIIVIIGAIWAMPGIKSIVVRIV